MLMSRRVAALLLGIGTWNWLIWPNFLRNIWRDDRSWDAGPTGFFLVHLVLVVVSLALATAAAVAGWRGLRASPRQPLPNRERHAVRR
jgi:hypothetical protein